MMELVKLPVLVPSIVCESEVVGFGEVLQQTPRAVTDEPPSDEMLPPQRAEVVLTCVAFVVVTTASCGMTVTVLVAIPVQPLTSVPVTEYVVVALGVTVMEDPVCPMLHI